MSYEKASCGLSSRLGETLRIGGFAMRYLPAALVLSVSAVCAACSGGTPVSPSSTTTSASTSLSLSTDPTIGFDHLGGLPCDRYIPGGSTVQLPDGRVVPVLIPQPF